MNILEFGKIMSKEVGDALGEEVCVDFKEVLKNNGVTYHALVIKKKYDNVAPTIYLDNLFESYKNGKVLMSAVSEIIKVYREYEPAESVEISFYCDFANVSDKLGFKVVNYYKNLDMLSSIPYLRFADLALVPYCVVNDRKLGSGTITIRNEHLKEWEISKEELWENVYENSSKVLPVEVKDILECVPLSGDVFEGMTSPDMYVLSNSSHLYGASAFLYPGVLQKLSKELNSSLVIIPSSVHEVIALPYDGIKMNTEFLFNMVKEVNETVIAEGEILSDNVYYYDMKTDKMGILKD